MKSTAGGHRRETGSVVLGSLTVPGHPRHVSRVRDFVRRAAAVMPTVDSDAATLLVSELVTNAIQHTKSGTDGAVTIIVASLADGLLVEVTDDGSAGQPMVKSDLYAAQGHGLFLVQQVAAQWGYMRDPAGTTVWFHLPEADDSAAGGSVGASWSGKHSADAGQNTGTDSGELFVADDVRRHRVNQITEGPQPDTRPDRRGGSSGDVHIAAKLHDPDGAEDPYVGHSWQFGRGLQPVAQSRLDPDDLRVPALRISAEQDVEGRVGDGAGQRVTHEGRPMCEHR